MTAGDKNDVALAKVPGASPDSPELVLNSALKRSDSYGLKSHREANKALLEILEANSSLVNLLHERVRSESVIQDEVIETAAKRLKDIKALREETEKLQAVSGRKKLLALFSSGKKYELYNNDLKYLDKLSDQLAMLIQILQIAKRKQVDPRTLQVPSQHRDRDVSVSSAPSVKAQMPSEEEKFMATHFFRLLKRPEYPYWQRHVQYSTVPSKTTCNWFFETEEYLSWQDDQAKRHHRVFWLTGSPGTGKSVLTSRIVDRLLNHGRHVAYFYFGPGKVQTFYDVVGSLLAQIYAVTKEEGLSFIRSHSFDGHSQALVHSRTLSYFDRFANAYHPHPTIVLDGWDPENMDNVDRFNELLSLLNEKGFKMLISSRSYSSVFISLAQTSHMSLPHDDQRQDWRRFAEDLIRQSPSAPGYELLTQDNKLREAVLHNHNFGGSFPKIRLFVEQVLQQISQVDLYQVLDLTDPVDLFFGHNRGKTSPIHEASVLWLSQTKRPITIWALQEVLTFVPNVDHTQSTEPHQSTPLLYHLPSGDSISRQSHYPSISFLQHSGKGLLWIDQISSTVALSHKDMFQGRVLPATVEGLYSLGDMCVYYLSVQNLNSLDYRDFDTISRYCQKNHFLRYAACTWQDHAEQQEISDRMRPQYLELLGSRAWLLAVLALQEWYEHDHEDKTSWEAGLYKIQETTALHVAIRCGDVACLRSLLQDYGTDRGLRQADLEGLLTLAHEVKQGECFDLVYGQLMDLTLRVNRSGHTSQEADLRTKRTRWEDYYVSFDKRHRIDGYENNFEILISAIISEDILALQSVWTREFDRVKRNAIGVRILAAAITNARPNLVEMLLQKGFQPYSTSIGLVTNTISLLHQAASKGDIDLVRLLIKYDASVYDLDHRGNSVLISAIDACVELGGEDEDLELIEFLLTRGVNIHARNKDKVTALDYAVQKNLPKVVALLLQYGASPSNSSESEASSYGVTTSGESDNYNLSRSSSGMSEISELLVRRRRIEEKLRKGANRARKGAASPPQSTTT